MEPWYISIPHVLAFLGVFIRVVIMLFLFPYFRGEYLPLSFKAFTAIAISLLLYLPFADRVVPLSPHPVDVMIVVVSEIATGTVFALSVLIVMGAFEVAGDIVSFQMGFGFARVADPVTGVQITVISRFFQIIATLIFFAINGHHFFIRALYESLDKIPVGSFYATMSTEHFERLIAFSATVFILAFKIAAPVMIALFLGEIGMGLIVKFAPQINVLVVGFAFTILLGIFFAWLSIEAWTTAIAQAFRSAESFLFQGLLVK